MGLFGTKKTSKGTIEEVIDMIDRYYKRRGLDIAGHQLDGCEGYGWWLMEGAAKVYVFVQEDKEGPVIRVNSPILHIPPANCEAFYRKLLEINRDLSGCCLSLFDEVVMVTGQRPTRGLDQEELNDLVWNVSYVADTLEDQLSKQFDARVFIESGV